MLETKINLLILFYEKVFVFPFRIFFYLNLFSLLRIFFNPSVLADTSPIFPYGNAPQCYGTRQGEAENFLLCEFGRAALFFCLIEKPDIKDYRLYRSISSMMSRRLYSRGILCCPPSLLWSRNQASNIPVLAGMISRHSSAILLNRLAS